MLSENCQNEGICSDPRIVNWQQSINLNMYMRFHKFLLFEHANVVLISHRLLIGGQCKNPDLNWMLRFQSQG